MTQKIIQSVKQQYERHPYPPIPRFALPRVDQGRPLRWETGASFAKDKLGISIADTHHGKRILVAGCGTIEALVVANQHPHAKEIIAVDLSDKSLAVLKTRFTIAKLKKNIFTFGFGRKLPPLKLIQADLHEWDSGEFDYIIASNMLQHVPDAALMFTRLAGFLKPGGLLRIVTYPNHSRMWVRLTARYLKEAGLSPTSENLINRSENAINKLSKDHPIRSCYMSQPETKHLAGLIDAFYHSCERPLSPLHWKVVSEKANLSWVAEDQTESSRSEFVDEFLPKAKILPPWIKLQILDDALELCANPVLWFLKKSPASFAKTEWCQIANSFPSQSNDINEDLITEISMGLKRINILLKPIEMTAKDVHTALKNAVGPRIMNDGKDTPLPGMSLSDYNWSQIEPK